MLGRAGPVALSARESHVVLMPAPPQRQTRPKPKVKGAKPEPPRIQLMLRDVVMPAASPPFDLYLVLEGPNIFEATATRLQVGTLEPAGNSEKRAVVIFDANDAFHKLAKTRGFNIRHLRVVLVRRSAAAKPDAASAKTGKDAAPTASRATEIGAIELVRS